MSIFNFSSVGSHTIYPIVWRLLISNKQVSFVYVHTLSMSFQMMCSLHQNNWLAKTMSLYLNSLATFFALSLDTRICAWSMTWTNVSYTWFFLHSMAIKVCMSGNVYPFNATGYALFVGFIRLSQFVFVTLKCNISIKLR